MIFKEAVHLLNKDHGERIKIVEMEMWFIQVTSAS